MHSVADARDAPTDAAHDGGAAGGERVVRTTTWRTLGAGVAIRETDTTHGEDVAITLSGWRITDASGQAWTDALYDARLRALGTRWLYAVRGPADVDGRSHDLAVAALAADLRARITLTTRAVLVVAHSSGALVAAELFRRLFASSGDGAALRSRVLFVSLDGDADVPTDPLARLDVETVGALRYAWFVSARDSVGGTGALANTIARAQQRRYADRSAFLEYDARGAGCTTVLCVHVSLVNPRPRPRGNESYAHFDPDGPNTWWLAPVIARWER
ncbi:MAG: hypothetical protein WCJ30_29685 [Deltaproteobacteria bacterium]